MKKPAAIADGAVVGCSRPEPVVQQGQEKLESRRAGDDHISGEYKKYRPR